MKVRVTRSCLNEGDRVEILAEDDAEYVFEELEGHRAAPERKLKVITARTIATGEDAAAIIDRLLAPVVKPPKQKQPRNRKPSVFGLSPLSVMVGKPQNPLLGMQLLILMMMPGMFIVMAFLVDHATPWQKPTDQGELYNASWGSVLAVVLWGSRSP